MVFRNRHAPLCVVQGGDVVRASARNASLGGGTRDDKLFRGSDADVIDGNDGADRIVGGTDPKMLGGISGVQFFGGTC